MDYKLHNNILNLHKEDSKDHIAGGRRAVVNALEQGVDKIYLPELRRIVNYVIYEKWVLFDIDELKSGVLYDDDIFSLVLPTIRRMFSKVYINPPGLFRFDSSPLGRESNREELYKLYFNIDDFLGYMVKMLVDCKDNILKDFEYIDRSAEFLSLLVDNYVGFLVDKVKNCENIDNEIKILKRNSNIDKLLL